jgi:hypothetical protein
VELSPKATSDITGDKIILLSFCSAATALFVNEQGTKPLWTVDENQWFGIIFLP